MQRHHEKIKPEPSINEIPTMWAEAVALESIAPVGLRGGLARKRTSLLASVPSWQLPAILDQLVEATA